MKKIIITYATAGIGHKKAAFAIRDALSAKKNSDIIIKIIDILEYSNAFFRKSYPTIYLLLINRLILLWGFFYYILDNRCIHNILFPIRRFLHIINCRRLIKFILNEKPDIIISTHFLTPDICLYIKNKYKINISVVTVITDYRAHSFWVSKGTDIYIVADKVTARDLVEKWGISKDKIHALGIPVEPKFALTHDRNFFRKKFDISGDSLVLLLIGGGYGVGPMLGLLTDLEKRSLRLTVITVCGHNKKLFSDIEKFKISAKFLKVTNFSYIENVDEVMAASDLYIGKPGGISITEAFTQDLPLVLIRPIPGQETRNARFIAENKIGVICKNLFEVSNTIEGFAKSKENLLEMKKNIERIKKPKAASAIADFIINNA